jgi:hypothetical protein
LVKRVFTKRGAYEVLNMKMYFPTLVLILAFLLLLSQPSVWAQYCSLKADGDGVIEGIGNRYPGGSATGLFEEQESEDHHTDSGFSAEEPEVVTTEEPDGGFSAEEPKVVNTEEPDGGFSSGEWRSVGTTNGKTTRGGKSTKRTARMRSSADSDWDLGDFDPDFHDPFFDSTVVEVPWQRFYPPAFVYPQPGLRGRGRRGGGHHH